MQADVSLVDDLCSLVIVSAGVLLPRARPGGEAEVLVIRRRSGSVATWKFPKGRLEAKDNADKVTCAFRELAEEAGVMLAPPAGCPTVGVEKHSTRWGA